MRETETARVAIMSAATARPVRGALAGLLVIVGDVAVHTAERLLGVPHGTVYLAGDEDTAAEGLETATKVAQTWANAHGAVNDTTNGNPLWAALDELCVALGVTEEYAVDEDPAGGEG